MLVGIIDWDLFINKSTFLPNLEVMLISAYHKKNGDIVHLLLNEKNIEVYDKIYLRRNKKGSKKFPEAIYGIPNIDIGGQYYSNGIILPPEEKFLNCAPDTTIYDNYILYCKKQDKKVSGLKKIYNTNFISLKKDYPFKQKYKNIILYDYDIGKEEELYLLQEAFEQGFFKKISFYFPIYCKDVNIAIEWAKKDWINFHTKIIIPKKISWQDIYVIQKEKIKIPIISYLTNKDKKIIFEEEIDAIVLDALRKNLYCMINEVKAKFKINPFLKSTEQYKIIKIISDWSVATIQPSFYSFCCGEVKKDVERIMKKYPYTKKYFLLSPHEYRKKGGIWLNDW